jgi:hypothetical protein
MDSEFNLKPYDDLREQLTPRGIRVYLNGRHQLVVSTQNGPAFPTVSNSGWVTIATGEWHISTWQPIAYAVPNDVDIAELCTLFVMSSPKVVWQLSDEMVIAHRLRELSEEDFEVLSKAMPNAP